MFAYIKGEIILKTNQYIVIENNGIGYKIFMSQNSIDKIEIGDNTKIHTYYHVREDNISLYGFLGNDELRMFELLLSVNGVGAKSAIAMLSSILPSDFALAIMSNDSSKLTKIPGVGAKTAARIVLDLQDKLKTEEGITKSENTESVQNISNNSEEIEEAKQALQILGYTKKEIEKVFDSLDLSNLDTQTIIKKALGILAK